MLIIDYLYTNQKVSNFWNQKKSWLSKQLFDSSMEFKFIVTININVFRRGYWLEIIQLLQLE